MNYYKSNRIFASSLGFSLFAILFSLVVEYGYSIKPCNLCLWQRWGFVSISTVSLIGIIFENKKWTLRGVFLLFSCLFFVSSYHALIQYGFLADPCAVPKITSTDDFWKMLNTPLPCSKISFSIFGIPVSVLNALFSLGFSVFIAIAIVNTRRNNGLITRSVFKTFKG